MLSPSYRIDHVYSSDKLITIKLTLPTVEMDPLCNIVLNIYKHYFEREEEKFQKIGNIYIQYPFKEYYTIDDLRSGTSYKINSFLTINKNVHHSALFTKTLPDPKGPLKILNNNVQIEENTNKVFSRTEEILYKYTSAKSTNLPIYKGEKDLKKNIMDARSSKSWKDYQSSGYKFAKPKENFEARKKRVWLVANGHEVFDQVHDILNQKQGYNVLEGDWFMGPFYSYDNNVKYQGFKR